MPARNTMNVSLPTRLRRYVDAKLESGRYGSASEVVREALRLLEQTELHEKKSLSGARRQIAVGLRQLDRGDLVDGESVFREIAARSRKRRQKAGA